MKGEGVRADRAFTGRCNLFAERSGVLVIDKTAIDALNRIDEAITVATLPAYKPVVEGEMIATVKIIPFAVAGTARDQAVAAAAKAKPVIRVAPYKLRKIGVVSTLLPGLSPKVVEKTLKITATRIAPAGASIIAERRVPHEQAALARAIDEVLKAGAELVIVFGASAIADRRDVIPAAIEAVGGEIEHFGMPVDPGNLMLIGRLRGQAVLGAPGCARSPKENGFDWVLMRLARRLAGNARGYHRHGSRRFADGNRHASAAAGRTGAGEEPSRCRRRACRWAFDAHGRGQQNAGRNRRQATGADRRRTGDCLPREAGDRRHRSRTRESGRQP